MPSISLDPPSGRYLSFAEREEIAVLCAQERGVREIARHLGRSPATISRELRSIKDGKYRRILPEWVDDYIRQEAERQEAA